MEKQIIFLITPLGNKQSEARIHADKMWNSVFCPLQKQECTDDLNFELVRSDLRPESGNSRIREIMNLIRISRGCIVDLYNISNLNVIYEVGLAHSQGKKVFFLRSDKISHKGRRAALRCCSFPLNFVVVHRKFKKKIFKTS